MPINVVWRRWPGRFHKHDRSLGMPLLALLLLAATACGSDGGTAVDAGPTSPSDVTADLPLSPDDSIDLLAPPEDAPDLPADLYEPPPFAATRLRYDMAARPMDLPFPYDRCTGADDGSPTGHRVFVDEDDFSSAIVGETLNFLPPFKDVINLVDGFGPYAWYSVEFVGQAPLDFRQEAADELPADAPVRMLAIARLFERDATLRDVSFSFDMDGDGIDDVRRPGEPGFIGSSPLNSVALSVEGSFPRHDFRDPDYHDGAFRLGGDGTPIPDHEEPIHFWMTFPTEPAGGPWPIVILLHGIDAHRNQMRRFAAGLAAEGLAAIAYDLPEHGDDFSPTGFLPVDKVFALRDNFRQAGVDLLTATYLLEEWADEGIHIEGLGDDGVAYLDLTRVGLLGHSLGTMCAIMGSGLRQQPEGLVLGVGGGGVGLPYFLSTFVHTGEAEIIHPWVFPDV